MLLKKDFDGVSERFDRASTIEFACPPEWPLGRLSEFSNDVQSFRLIRQLGSSWERKGRGLC